ncbi:hypothetical protein PIB30_102136 [Stylosanthes scabra]|uniref:RRM domain-containing protein n=1 Tax=Stylosanthes scabra TaxID=79078 RepID=A0ABU6ZWE9_9FABA|nr:hypothetical protein [Stylosanthes scabra]
MILVQSYLEQNTAFSGPAPGPPSESAGWVALGDGRVYKNGIRRRNSSEFEDGVHTIFVDNLHHFDTAGDARKAIDRLNGRLWKGSKLMICVSKYRRRDTNEAVRGNDHGKHFDQWTYGNRGRRRESRARQIWVEVGKKNSSAVSEKPHSVGKVECKPCYYMHARFL